VVKWAALSKKDLTKARERGNVFTRRTTPHALAHVGEEAEPEKQIEIEDNQPLINSPGILYGTWWHDFVQTIPWQQPKAAWQQIFLEAQASSPQSDRSQREWELFCRSSLAQWLAEPGRIIQVELPFLWRETDESCLEGVMDLAVYMERESTWRVIDWKTNQIGTKGSGALVEIYRGQIEAYVRALREMLSAEVKGSLYLTATGQWLDVS
jgi:ATP-dependent exoDNAse (exonuclease V) beta subunit